MAIIWHISVGFKGKTLELRVLNKWVFVSAPAIPHCGARERSGPSNNGNDCETDRVSKNQLVSNSRNTGEAGRMSNNRNTREWRRVSNHNPVWRAADAEIKVPSGENTELKRSPYQAWSRSVYSHTCYAYCQGFLPCLFLHFRSIHLHFIQNFSRNFSCVSCG